MSDPADYDDHSAGFPDPAQRPWTHPSEAGAARRMAATPPPPPPPTKPPPDAPFVRACLVGGMTLIVIGTIMSLAGLLGESGVDASVPVATRTENATAQTVMVSAANTQLFGVVTSNDGTVAAVAPHGFTGTIQIHSQLWSDEATVVWWDRTTGVAILSTKERRMTATKSSEVNSDFSPTPTPTTVVNGITLRACGCPQPEVPGNSLVSDGPSLKGLAVVPLQVASTDAARAPTRWLVSYATLVELTRRVEKP